MRFPGWAQNGPSAALETDPQHDLNTPSGAPWPHSAPTPIYLQSR